MNGLFMNEENYQDPWCFRPERFLNDKNEFMMKDDFNPFGIGWFIYSIIRSLMLNFLFRAPQVFGRDFGQIQHFPVRRQLIAGV
jgi:hypothetical protein